MSTCPTCGDSGTFYAATESVYLGWKTGYARMYEMQRCPCTPRVARVRAASDLVPHGIAVRRAAVALDGLTRKEGKG